MITSVGGAAMGWLNRFLYGEELSPKQKAWKQRHHEMVKRGQYQYTRVTSPTGPKRETIQKLREAELRPGNIREREREVQKVLRELLDEYEQQPQPESERAEEAPKSKSVVKICGNCNSRQEHDPNDYICRRCREGGN